MSKETPKAAISRRDFVKSGTAAGLGATALAGLVRTDLEAQGTVQDWDMTADVVIAGAGTSGLSAAVEARDSGASVIIVEENHDCGGHGIVSGGNVNLGGGTSRQWVTLRKSLTYFRTVMHAAHPTGSAAKGL